MSYWASSSSQNSPLWTDSKRGEIIKKSPPLAAAGIHAFKRESLLLLIVTDDLGNLLLSNNFEAVCNTNSLALKSRVRKRSSAPCSPTSAWNSDAQYCIFNTKFWAKLGIFEIWDSKNFGFSGTSTSTGKRVLDFFFQNPETLINFLSNELLGVW